MTNDLEHAGESTATRRRGEVFARDMRVFTLGILCSVGVVAFESLGAATILPTAAKDLDGLGSYGWGLSALMLANIVGTVVAGASIDRRGPARTVLAGSLIFAVGCVTAGIAPSWGAFIAARAIQGLGVGATMAYAYSLVGIAYPARLQAVMFAYLSSAWTLPSLVGPVFAGLVKSWADWRVVFWALSPVTLVLLPLVLPNARRLGTAADAIGTRLARRISMPVLFSIVLTAGTCLFLVGLESDPPPLAIALCLAGFVVAVGGLRQVAPAGTLTVRAGVPAGIVIRFLLCAVYFGSEAFLPLGLTRIHHLGVTLAALGLAAGALAWTAGSFLQARIDSAHPGRRPRSVTVGALLLLAGEFLMGSAVAFHEPWVGWAIIGWTVGGAGMGIAFNAATSATMSATGPDSHGSISASLQLAQTLATATIAGVGGAILAATGTTTSGFLSVFGITAALGLAGALLGGRLRAAPG